MYLNFEYSVNFVLFIHLPSNIVFEGENARNSLISTIAKIHKANKKAVKKAFKINPHSNYVSLHH